MTHTKNESDKWEERFDEDFVNKLAPHNGNGDAWSGEEGIEHWDTLKYSDEEGTVERIKDFIHQTIQQERQQLIDEVVALAKDHYWDSLEKDRDLIILHIKGLLNNIKNSK